MTNFLLLSDSYKASHFKLYPPGMTHQFSYMESRGGLYQEVLFFGLQYYLKKYLVGEVIDYGMIKDARKFFRQHFGSETTFNEDGWMHILGEHKGRLPVEIKAIAEGTVVPVKNVLLTIENTCPQDFWLTSWLETLLEKIWYPISVGTVSYMMKRTIKFYLNKTGDNIPDFLIHDFGYRGSTSEESAGIGDMAHLVNFKGTDTLAGILMAQKYYNTKDMLGFSVAASEHSTITSWGKDREVEAFENMINQYPEGIISCVSDSYSLWNALENIWGDKLKDKVINRKGTLVIRLDSGNPPDIVRQSLNILGEKFGFTVNKKGYKVLPPYLRVIQGDGINNKMLTEILYIIEREGWSIDNVVFGSGGGLLQDVTRDTFRFAYKTSNVTINGKDYPVSKDPITDPGKKSKAGRLALRAGRDKNENIIDWTTQSYQYPLINPEMDELKTVFKNGELLIDQNFEDIRKRAEASL